MERAYQGLELIKEQTILRLDRLCRQKVQFKEQLDEAETQYQFQRGVLIGIEQAQRVIKDVQQAEQIESMEQNP